VSPTGRRLVRVGGHILVVLLWNVARKQGTMFCFFNLQPFVSSLRVS
jgi:hypothetical protein